MDLTQIRASVVGDGAILDGPYGKRRLTYADWTATGRPLSFIDDYLKHVVEPVLGNVHSSASFVGAQTEAFREEARRIIAKSVNASDEDVVVFTGAGATGAIDKLIRCMGLTDERAVNRPAVLVGPGEHHSNDLPWRESICHARIIDECSGGQIDLDDLRDKLARIRFRGDRAIIGCFTAASNVTGILTDVRKIAEILHDYGALAFFDYAAAAPYVKVDVNPADEPLCYMDACFISPHKFPGGPGSSGVLVAKRRLFTNAVPSVPGGGTVAYVDSRRHVYLSGLPTREEGGTPNILGDIRAGLVFQTKELVGVEAIEAREQAIGQKALAAWTAEPNLHVLGNTEVPRLAAISFLVRHGGGYLHHGFVAALLNDLFGIQARSGCSCAAPYGHRLLGISDEQADAIMQQVQREDDGLPRAGSVRPGWVRVSFAPQMSDVEVDYVIRAVQMVARDGWRAMTDYGVCLRSGRWTHRGWKQPLAKLDLMAPEQVKTLPDSVLGDQLAEAERILGTCGDRCAEDPPEAVEMPNEQAAMMKWFPTPQDAAAELAQERPKLFW